MKNIVRLIHQAEARYDTTSEAKVKAKYLKSLLPGVSNSKPAPPVTSASPRPRLRSAFHPIKSYPR
jgi:hypothetical protein